MSTEQGIGFSDRELANGIACLHDCPEVAQVFLLGFDDADGCAGGPPFTTMPPAALICVPTPTGN